MSRRPNTGLATAAAPGLRVSGSMIPRVVAPQRATKTLHSLTVQTHRPGGVQVSEPNHLQLLLKLFHAFVDKIMALTTHNGGDYAFRTSLAQEISLVESAFGVFLRQAMQYTGTVPMLRQGRKSSDVVSPVSLRKAAGNFLKQWRSFAESLVAARVSGPASILASIRDNVQVVTESLREFLKVKPEANSIHDPSVRLAKTYQQQIHQFYDDISAIESLGDEPERVNELCEDIKEYSRRLSESFKTDFTGCGLTYTELSVLMTKSFGSCSDVIHGLKASVLFTQDMRNAFDAFDDFQALLETILVRLNLPTTLLYRRAPSERKFDIEPVLSDEDVVFHEEEDEFEGLDDIEQVLRKGAEIIKMSKGPIALAAFMRALKREIPLLTEKLAIQQKTCADLEAKLEAQGREYEEMLTMEKSTNLMMCEEVEKLKEEAQAKDKEIEHLRKREQDNEFKKCLRDVAKQLGGVVKEESVKFDHDEDDDQLIKYVNALSVYVIEKKCATCGAFAEREDKVKTALMEIVTDASADADVLEICEMTKKRWDELNSKSNEQQSQIENLQEELSQLKSRVENVCANLGESEKIEDIGQFLENSIQEAMNKHQAELREIEEKAKAQMNDVASRFKESFAHFIEQENSESPIEDALQTAHKFTTLYEQKMEELETVRGICEETRTRLSRFLGLKPGDETLGDSIRNMLTNLEERPNPLKPRVAELEERNNHLVMSIHILANRLSGIASIDEDKDMSTFTTRQLTDHLLGLLDKMHDIFEERGKLLKSQTEQATNLRSSLEILTVLMRRYLGEESKDMSTVPVNNLIFDARELCEKVTDPCVNAEFLNVRDINSLFESVWPMVFVSSRSEPKQYIPEILSAYVGLYNSVQMMKPFAVKLSEMFGIFDFNNKCFDVTASEFNDVQTKVVELHKLMKEISPSKTNPVVFEVLERFVTVVWTFLDVAAGHRSEAFVTREKV